MVSKLNVRPFHRVNSPLDAPEIQIGLKINSKTFSKQIGVFSLNIILYVPVISLLPSGVQASVNMGHRILLVAVFTNLVVTALVGFSCIPMGGNSWG